MIIRAIKEDKVIAEAESTSIEDALEFVEQQTYADIKITAVLSVKDLRVIQDELRETNMNLRTACRNMERYERERDKVIAQSQTAEDISMKYFKILAKARK